MKQSRTLAITLAMAAAPLLSSTMPQAVNAAEYHRTYSYTRTVTSPVVVTEWPVMVERVVDRPAVVERVVERPVTIERVVEKPVMVEKVVEKPTVIERRVEMPVIIDRTTNDHLIRFNVLRLLHLGLF